MVVKLALLLLGSYLLGSVPAAYLAAKWSRGLDVRQYGTGQTGAGNLWRMTSWRLGLPVLIFDMAKGMAPVWAAQLIGLDIAQQVAVGLAAIIGHNWPVFLRFSGGRGIGTTIGVIVILPLISDITPWVAVICLTIGIGGTLIIRSSPVPALAGVAMLPLVSWWFNEPLPVILGFLAILLIVIIKRLTAPKTPFTTLVSRQELLFSRLFFDRDIKDKKTWLKQRPFKQEKQGED